MCQLQAHVLHLTYITLKGIKASTGLKAFSLIL